MKIVIARYNEPIDWIQKIDPSLSPHVIYNKGNDDLPSHFNVVKVPNEGREAETYLRYIIDNYDQLEGEILFCQGNPFDHMERTIIGTERLGMNSSKGCENDLMDFMNTFHPNTGFTALGPWYACTLDGHPHFHHNMKHEMDLMFNNFDKECLWFVQGAQFIVSANDITRRPLSFYKKLLSRGQQVGLNFYAYILERMWFYIFHSSFEHCV